MDHEGRIVLVTGSCGLVGLECCLELGTEKTIHGFDNFARGRLLKDPTADTYHNMATLRNRLGENYIHHVLDVRNLEGMRGWFSAHMKRIDAIIHCAAQTAHEGEVREDFETNVVGTLNLLELWRTYCPEAKFIYLSTIKVYGNYPNELDYKRLDHRYELVGSKGFDEKIPLGEGISSFFGRSKLAADLYVQEYHYQYGLEAYVLRPSCITGPRQMGTEAHGMLGYLMKCAYLKKPYTVYGHHGCQVRDQLYADHLAQAIGWVVRSTAKHKDPYFVFNLGGGLRLSCSTLEAIQMCEALTGNRMEILSGPPRSGDHRWWVTDTSLFENCYPEWKSLMESASVIQMLKDILEAGKERWERESRV